MITRPCPVPVGVNDRNRARVDPSSDGEERSLRKASAPLMYHTIPTARRPISF